MSPLQAPHADLLYIGKGKFFFRRKNPNGTYQPQYHMGNITEAGPTMEDTRLEKYSAMEASAPLLADRLQRRLITVNATFDMFSKENAGLLTMGEADAEAAQAATPIVAEVLSADVPATPVATLGSQLGNRIFMSSTMGPHTAIAVKLGAVTLALGTDYEVLHNAFGPLVIRILPGSVAVTDATDDLTLDNTPTAYAAGFPTINMGTESTIEGELLFIGDPSSGPAMMIEYWNVSVTPAGVFALISEEYSSGQLAMKVLSDPINHPDNPLGKLTFLGG
jgi:hypothetical protein